MRSRLAGVFAALSVVASACGGLVHVSEIDAHLVAGHVCNGRFAATFDWWLAKDAGEAEVLEHFSVVQGNQHGLEPVGAVWKADRWLVLDEGGYVIGSVARGGSPVFACP